MNREQIKKMVVEAGWSGLYTEFNEPDGSPGWKMVKKSLTVPVTFEQVEKFVFIVMSATKEEDAKICDWLALERDSIGRVSLQMGADAIRASK